MNAPIIVDVQNDFCPGGTLAVPEGSQIVPIINRIQPAFDLRAATRDWHPADHGSFATNHPSRRRGEQIELAGLPQILWPVHCVQGTLGAELHPGLDCSPRIARVFPKGTDASVDSYSGFFDSGCRSSTGLGDYLRDQGVTEVYVCGLATDYCVKATILDALALGFKAYLIEDACRGVEIRSGDTQQAIGEMQEHGATIVQASDVMRV